MQPEIQTGIRPGEPGATGAVPGRIAMHPDDYAAHLAWVTAKRIQERLFNGTFCEKPVYFRILGSGILTS